MAGSLLMLAAVIALGFSQGTFDMVGTGTNGSDWIFLGFVAAFAVKAPLFPFHGWLPEAYRESSPEVAAVLSGVISKAAAYGFLRIAIAKFPGPAVDFRIPILVLAGCGLIYGSLLAFRAPDVRGVIAYSSLAQMGLITFGLFAINDLGLNGAVLQMVNHGLISASLFLLAGGIERRAATGELDRLGGMARGRPALATVLMALGVIALAVPGSAAFAGEFAILAGVFQTGWGWAVVGAIAIVLAAMYMLRLISAVLHKSPGPVGLRGRARPAPGRARDPRPTPCLPARAVVLASGDHRALVRTEPVSGRDRAGCCCRAQLPTTLCANGLSAPARRALIKLGIKLVESPDCNSQAGALGRALRSHPPLGAPVTLAAIATPSIDWFALSPSLVLLGAGVLSLFAAVLLPRRWRRPFGASVCALGFAGSFVAAALLYANSADGHGVIADAIQRDRLGALAQMVVAGAGLLVVGVAYAEPMPDDHVSEFYALLAWAGAGMVFLVTASSLMTIFLGLEWFSISLYILCAIDIDLAGSLEAGLKYLIIGSFGSAMLLFGSALVYGATGELQLNQIADAVQSQGLSHDALLVAGLAFLIVGLGFKASAAPFHMWTPDVYEGAPTPVTAFMSAATKTVALVLMMRVLVTAFPQEARLWTVTIAVIACASLAVGNLAALVQRNVKRMLAYSSISQAGFHADPDLDEQRARRAGPPLLPDPVRGDVGRLVRGRRRPGAGAEPAGHVRGARRLRLGAAAARCRA